MNGQDKKPKELTEVQVRLVAKLVSRGMKVTGEPQVRVNPYTGRKATLTPLLVGLYDWIVSPTRGDNIGCGKEDRQTWDRARFLFLALDSEAYYDLID